MMKRSLGFLLAVCFALTCCVGALAEETEPAAYTPGEITNALFEELPVGTLTCAALGLNAEFGDAFAELTGVDAQTLAALSEVLDNTSLMLACGAYEDGLLLELIPCYGDLGTDDTVSALLMLDASAEGLSVVSDLIEGKRITVSWETVLRMLGADDDMLAALESLASLTQEDVEAFITAALEQIATFAQKAGEVASPYVEALSSFFASLPMDTFENADGSNGYPAAPQVVVFTCTDKALGELVVTLADLLEKDATLAPLLDQVLASGMLDLEHEGETAMTTADLCAQLREAAGQMTDESRPIELALGFDEDGAPTYLLLGKKLEDGDVLLFSVSMTQPDENTALLSLIAGLADEENGLQDGLMGALSFGVDSANPDTVLVGTQVTAYEDGEVCMAQVQNITVTPTTGEGGLPGCDMGYVLSQWQEDAVVDMTMNGRAAQNANGGEDVAYEGTLAITAEDSDALTTDFSYTLNSATSNYGPDATVELTLSTPALGLDSYGMSLNVFTMEYSPEMMAGLETLPLESMTSEDLDALAASAAAAAQEKLAALMQKLPAALVEAMSSAE